MCHLTYANVLQWAHNKAQGLLECKSSTILGLVSSNQFWFISFRLFWRWRVQWSTAVPRATPKGPRAVAGWQMQMTVLYGVGGWRVSPSALFSSPDTSKWAECVFTTVAEYSSVLLQNNCVLATCDYFLWKLLEWHYHILINIRQAYTQDALTTFYVKIVVVWPDTYFLVFLCVCAYYDLVPNYSAFWGFPGGLVAKNSPAKQEAQGSIPGSGRSPGGGNGNPLQYPCLGNLLDRGAWRVSVHGVAKIGQTYWLNKE